MLPIETRYNIPTKVSSLQNTERLDGYQRQMCLLPTDLNKSSSRLINEYVNFLQSEGSKNNKMIPFGYSFQYNPYENTNNKNFCQVSTYPAPLKSSHTLLEPNGNGNLLRSMTRKMPMSKLNSSVNKRVRLTYSTEKTEAENHVQSWSNTNQDRMVTPSSSFPASSWPAITTSNILLPIKKRQSKKHIPLLMTIRHYLLYNLEYRKRMYQLPLEQPLPHHPNISTESIFPNCCSSLPLPQMADTLVRPSACACQIDLIRAQDFTPSSRRDVSAASNCCSTMIQQYSLVDSANGTFVPYQTFGQHLSNQRCSYTEKKINSCSRNHLSYNMPYLLPTPHESYDVCPFNPTPSNLAAIAYTTPLPKSNTMYSSLSLTNNMEKINKKQEALQKSKVVENPSVEMQTDEKKIVSIPSETKIIPTAKKRLQKKIKD